MTLATRLSSAAALAALALVIGAAAASAGPVDPLLNNPDYWEDGGAYDCSKVEYADGLKSFDLDPGSGFYVVKAGTVVTVVAMGDGYGYGYDDTYTSVKDISYIITCIPTYDGGS